MRLYRRLLRLSAPSLDREYGQAMEETFARRLADARRRSRAHLLHLWLRELAGLADLYVRERRWKAGRMETVHREISHALRRLRHSPAFSGAAVLTLALALGANTAIFAVVERVLLRPLPYPDSNRLIELDHGALKLNASGFGTAPGLYFHYLDRARTIAGAALYSSVDLTITGDGEPERVRVTRATPSLVAVLGVQPALGRWFSEAEGLPGGRRVAVLSHALWSGRFRADPGVLGRTIAVGDERAEIVGVMPAAFAFPEPRVALWIAVQRRRSDGFGLWSFNGVARMREGVSFAEARAELNALAADVGHAYPDDPGAVANAETSLVYVGRTLRQATVGGIARPLWVVLVSVGLVLLVACANVANLFLVRSEARQREIAVRRALGASSAIARYFLAESLLLALAGGAAGLALAWAALRLVVRFGPANLPRATEIQLDPVGVAYALALSVLTAIVFGLLPLMRGRGFQLSLQDASRGNTAGRSRHRARQALMGAQVAFALVLLVASGLMARSFANMRGVDPGFNAQSALTFNIGLPAREYPTLAADLAAHTAIAERLAALPGVTAVSMTTCLPLSGGCHGNTVKVEGRVLPSGTMPPIATFRAIGAGYVEAMGMRILQGRSLTRDEIERGARVAIVSETFARRVFPGENPIGRRVASNRPPPAPLEWLEIVGVAANTPVMSLTEPSPLAQLFMPISVARGPDSSSPDRLTPSVASLSYVVRTATPPLELMPAVRQALSGFNRNLAIAQPRTLDAILTAASAQMAFTMALLAIAAAVALLLGVIGIYGVMSYIVSQRTSEIGVRLALGAEPAAVAGAIVRQGGRVAIAGIAAGLAAALAGGRAIESLLFGVSPRDPGVFVVTAVLLLGVVLAACWLPARRAMRSDPLSALRTE